MAIYEVIVRDPATAKIWELIPKSYSFTEKLNAEPQATFSCSYEELEKMATANGTTVLDIFTAALREIYITRDGTKIFYGVVSDFEVAPSGVGEENVTIKAIGFFGLFRKRLVGIGTKTVYTATDAGDIAWDLILDSQASDPTYSDWGITQGATPATKVRDREYLFDNIYDAIVRLSNENLEDGFDFDIDTTKAFNVYYPTKGTARPLVVFDERTMSGWRYSKGLFLQMANIVYALGQGFNEDILYETRTAAVGYRTPFGTLQEKLQTGIESETGTLQDHGDRRLLDARDPVITLTDVMHYDKDILYTDYNLGDTVIVNLPDLDIDNLSKRVIERNFTMQSPDSIALCRLKLKST